MTRETAQARLKRLTMRSWRRGTREMDLILGGFADQHLADMGTEDLEIYDRVLAENDHDLYQWVSGQAPAPTPLRAMLGRITGHIKSG